MQCFLKKENRIYLHTCHENVFLLEGKSYLDFKIWALPGKEVLL
jgi:hypothetical protein